MRVLDGSFTGGVTVPRAWFLRRRAEGFRAWVQCLWTGGYANNPGLNRVAEGNLAAARDAGLLTAGYFNANPWWPAATSLEEAKRNAGAEWEHLTILFTDVEIAGTEERHIREHLMAAEDSGKRTAIYTARWFWRDHLGDPTWPWLTTYRLWNAFYDGDPDIDFPSWPYGPWRAADVAGEQYANTTIWDGVEVDLNEFDELWFIGKETFMALTPAEESELKYWLTPRQWGKLDAGGRLDGLGPPWFGRKDVSPMRMMADHVLPWLDYIHLGTIFREHEELKKALGNVQPAPLAEADLDKLAEKVAALVGADIAKRMAE